MDGLIFDLGRSIFLLSIRTKQNKTKKVTIFHCHHMTMHECIRAAGQEERNSGGSGGGTVLSVHFPAPLGPWRPCPSQKGSLMVCGICVICSHYFFEREGRGRAR